MSPNFQHWCWCTLGQG